MEMTCRPSIEEIENACLAATNTPYEDYLYHKRSKNIMLARKLIYYVCAYCGYSAYEASSLVIAGRVGNYRQYGVSLKEKKWLCGYSYEQLNAIAEVAIALSHEKERIRRLNVIGNHETVT